MMAKVHRMRGPKTLNGRVRGVKTGRHDRHDRSRRPSACTTQTRKGIDDDRGI